MVKHLIIVHVMDHVSLMTSVWLIILVKMVVHVLLLTMVVVTDAPVHCTTLDTTVKVQ